MRGSTPRPKGSLGVSVTWRPVVRDGRSQPSTAAASIDVGSVSTKFSEFVLEMLFGLRGDIPDPLLALEVGDELSGCAHPPTIWEMAASARTSVVG